MPAIPNCFWDRPGPAANLASLSKRSPDEMLFISSGAALLHEIQVNQESI